MNFKHTIFGSALGALAFVAPAAAQNAAAGDAEPKAKPAQRESVDDAFDGIIFRQSGEVVQKTYALTGEWTSAQAEELLTYIGTVEEHGLVAADYLPEDLADAIRQGESEELNQAASQSFVWLVEDLRDGRTPMEARKQWFVVDPDVDRTPTGKLLAQTLANGEVTAALDDLHPTHPDYAKLKQALAETPAEDTQRRKLIRANMDRWRWLQRDLGRKYLLTNVPEYKVRLTVGDKIIKSYRTVVGKPGRTATPQLAEMVEGVIFNPTWTVPQSIVKGEGLGAKVLGNPGWARAKGYKATKGENGWVTVVQQPGPTNSLGLMKLDMPNAHAIFLHDTPSRHLFRNENRALSHGCIRVEGARELAMTMAMLGNANSRDDIPVIQKEVEAITGSGEYTRYPIEKQWPVYITYFTMASDTDGELSTFKDIYGRDEPVVASLDAARVRERARETNEEVIEILDDPRADEA